MPDDNDNTTQPLTVETRMFILNKAGQPVRIKDQLRWQMWRTLTNTRIAVTPVGPVQVSTAFMALDHQLVEGLDPILWETRVLADPATLPLAGRAWHCGGNQQDAQRQHDEVVEMVRREYSLLARVARGARRFRDLIGL